MIPERWKITSLGDICTGELQTGPFGSQLHAHEYVEEGVPVLMPKDLVNMKANIHSAAMILPEKAKILSKHQLKEGDLLFSRRGDVARFALIAGDSVGALCGTGCLKATPSNKHSSKFLAYFLQKNAVKRWLEQNAVGQTMPNMNTAILSELPLMAASSKDEEEKIAQILLSWDKAIETVENLIENSRQKKKALMQQLLTSKKRFPGFDGEWKSHHLTEVAEIIVSPVDKKSVEGEVPVRLCNYTDVYYNDQITSKLEFMNATASQREIDRYTLQVNDVIITKDSETPGDIAIPAVVSEDLNGVVCGYHLAIIRPKEGRVDGQFLSYLFSMPHTRYYFFTFATGATRFGLSVGGIAKAQFNFPPFREQAHIAKIIRTFGFEVESYRAQLSLLQRQKKALIQQLLTGKRRVQVN